MQILDFNDLAFLSFPDTEVTEFTLDMNTKNCVIRCSDAYLGAHPDGYFIQNVQLTISSFSLLRLQEFNGGVSKEIYEFDSQYELKDICEFNVSETQILLKGFSRVKGYWTEYIFENGKIEIRHN